MLDIDLVSFFINLIGSIYISLISFLDLIVLVCSLKN